MNIRASSVPFDKVYCPSHPRANLIEDSHAGDVICPECGLVVADRVIDLRQLWRVCTDERRNMEPCEREDIETKLNEYKTMYKNYDCSTRSREENRRMTGLNEIECTGKRVNAMQSVVVDRASNMFRQIFDFKSLKRHNAKAIAAACVYIACRQEGVCQSFREICKVSEINRREIGRCFKLILKEFETNIALMTTSDLMRRLCCNLSLPENINRAARHIAEQADQLDMVSRRSPISVTAASIYMASQVSEEKRSEKEIGEIAGVSDVIIHQSYKMMYSKAHDLFPKDFEFFTPIKNLPLP